PEWWSSAPVKSAAAEGVPRPVEVPALKKPTGLFDHLAEEEPQPQPAQTPAAPAAPAAAATGTASAAWLDRLFASQGYKDQRAFVRRHAPEDDVVRRCLAALDASGGIMTPAALSKAADIPAARLDGLIALIQRLLNVDGYEIMTFSRAE